MKINLLLAVSSSLLLLSSSLSLAALGAPEPGPSSSGVPSANARITEYLGAGCGQSLQTYNAIPRGVCVGDARTGGSMRVTCSSGAAPTFERFESNTACGGTPVISVVGVVAPVYDPISLTGCLDATAPVNSTATSSVVIQCAEPQQPWASRLTFAESTCSVRKDVTASVPQESETEFGACDSSQSSRTSDASFMDSGRLYDYEYSKTNCSAADIVSVQTIELNACLERPVQTYNQTLGRPTWSSEWRMVTGPSDATLRGSGPPSSSVWPPTADNTLAFGYQCGDSACSRGCRMVGVQKLGGCTPQYSGSNPVVEWQRDVCTADTKNGGIARYFDATCSDSKLTEVELNPADNKCISGRYTNCGNGKGVAAEVRVPAILPSLVKVSYDEGVQASTCTGAWEELIYRTTDVCFPTAQGTSVGAAKWIVVNNTATRFSYGPVSGSTVATPDCSGTPYNTETITLGACSYGIAYMTTAQAAAQAGISVDTTTISNGVDGNGAPGTGTGSSASTLSVSGLSFFFAALVAMIAQLTQ